MRRLHRGGLRHSQARLPSPSGSGVGGEDSLTKRRQASPSRPAHKGRSRRNRASGCSRTTRPCRSSWDHWSRGCGITCPSCPETNRAPARPADFHAAVHMHRQFVLPRQHFRRRGPSGPKRLSANLGFTLPGEALSPDADAILQRSSGALREIELAFARVDRERARGLARRIIDLLAGRAGHIDVFVEASRRRIVGSATRRQAGLRVRRRRSARQGKRKTEQGLRDTPVAARPTLAMLIRIRVPTPRIKLTPLQQPDMAPWGKLSRIS